MSPPPQPITNQNRRPPLLILLAFVAFAGFVWLLLTLLDENVNYFKTPSLISLADRQMLKSLRLGGLVETGSLNAQGSELVFFLTDGLVREKIHFNGVLPDLFREGQSVVVDGQFGVEGIFIATRILAKHDENYMSRYPAALHIDHHDEKRY